MTLRGRGSLTNAGFNREQLRQGGGRGNGNDHLDELIGATDVPPELKNYEAFRVTHRSGEKIPDNVLKRCHAWAHGRNFLHSFFKPMYGQR